MKAGRRERRERTRAVLLWVAYCVVCVATDPHIGWGGLVAVMLGFLAAYNYGAAETRRKSRERLARAVAAARKESP